MVKLIENMDSGTRKTPLCKTQQRYISSAIRKIKNKEQIESLQKGVSNES